MGRVEETGPILRSALALSGLSALERARLLRTEGRFAIDQCDLVRAGFYLDAAAAAAQGLDLNADPALYFFASLCQNRSLLECRKGDLDAAEKALDGIR